ncbi:hypothetical protein [Desmospora profundinema]|uniref:Na+/melibiose symporter-like transporter n=1 Tax=Desmospora profundinema TaxID=1571184 RepID=A0ABU1IMX2_9BACL|nr:hypothetical protein [Desmospora profundinema]MDR6226122.1 Na+/melibiose symporter-like transporter [Desmospora profundinema]
MAKSAKKSLILSCIFSFIVLPFVSVGALFYHLFSEDVGSGKKELLFNTIVLNIKETSFSFFINSSYLLLMVIVFVATFFIAFVTHRTVKVFTQVVDKK